MLRITMLKLKRAWSLALILRNRGHTRFPGKFHRLMTVRTARKSTNSNQDNSEWKCKQIIDYLFSPLRTHDEIRKIQSIIISDIRRLQTAINEQKENQNPQQPDSEISHETRCEKCNKIIAAIFGEQTSLDSGKDPDTKAPEVEVKSVLSTTAKQTEEQLSQKIEVIDETPLVEAEKSRIEGFNTPPRVLGHDEQQSPCIDIDGGTAEVRENVQDKFESMVCRLENSEIFSKVTPFTYGVVNCSGDCSNQGGKSGNTSEGDKQDEYDSIAKRHLNTPNNELENSLIKEMQQLGVPQSSDKSSINIQRDTTKKPRKPSAKMEIELEARKCENEPPTDSERDQKSDYAKNTNIRTLQTTPQPIFLTRLHEEGIRYTEQTTSSFVDKKKRIEHHLERRPPFDPHKPILLYQNKEIEKEIPIEQRKTIKHYSYILKPEEQPVSASRDLPTSPSHQLSPWTNKHPYFQDLSVSNELKNPDVDMIEKRPSYDPHRTILDPYDKKNITSDTETYDYEPLTPNTANFAEFIKNKEISHSVELQKTVEPEKTAESVEISDSSLIPNQTQGSYLDKTYQGLHLNRDMPYYYDQRYTNAGQFPNQPNARSTPGRQTQETYQQESSSANENASYDQSSQRNAWSGYSYSKPQQDQVSCENVPADENPDKIFLEQHTGDPSNDQADQPRPWMNPYQHSQHQQGQYCNENMLADANPDNIFLDQNTGDPSYEEASNVPWMHTQYPYLPEVKAGKVEQLHSALYTAGPYKGQLINFQQGFSNFPHQINPWNQYPYSHDQSMSNQQFSEGQQEENPPDSVNTMKNTDRRPLYDAHRPITDHRCYYKNATNQQIREIEIAVEPSADQTQTQTRITDQKSFYPIFQPFQPPAGFVAQNPYFYHHCYTYYGKFPHQHNFWTSQHSPEVQMTEFYQQTLPTDQQSPELSDQDANISPDQKTPIQATELRPAFSKTEERKFQPPAGPSAAFVSLPEPKWRAETTLKPSPKEEPVHDENVQMNSQGIESLPVVDTPLIQDEIIPLSEMLRRVRRRSRQEYLARWTQVDPFEGKCGRKRPPCPPPQPVCPKAEPPPPPPCPPPPPPCPRPCKPKCPPPCTPPTPGCPPPPPPCPPPKSPSCKFVDISLDVLYKIFTLIWNFGSSRIIGNIPLANCYLTQSAVCDMKAVTIKEVVAHEGDYLLTMCGSALESCCWKLETLTLARDFEPWVPVPSWPLPIKEKKKPYVCPKEGCKQRPPPRYGDPCERPCNPGNPCLGLPNKYRRH